MGKLKNAYATDAQAENDGAWVELRGGSRWKIRSEHSVAVREAARKLDKKYRAFLLGDGMPADKQDERDLELCATILVADWDKETAEELGTCTPDNVRAALRELPALRRDIVYRARIEETFNAEEVKLMAGNSARPSGTTAS